MRRTFFLKIFPALALALLTTARTAPAQTPATAEDATRQFRVYDSKGNAARLEDVIEAMGERDVILIGETHNDAATHVLEAELLRMAFARFAGGDEKTRRSIALSLEMFERDVQIVVDEYLAGLISERHFLAASRPWKNYQTDYRPLVEFARANKIPVVAANAPARYVSRVSQNGPGSLTALSAGARDWLPPLPFAPASKAYAVKFEEFMRGEAAPPNAPQTTPTAPAASAPANPHAAQTPHGGPVHLLDAQNLRDASMAFAVVEHLKRHPRPLVLHVNGKFHSEGGMGVPEHIRHYRGQTRVLVVTALPEADFDAQTMTKLGDFIVLTGAPAAPGR